MKVNYIHTFLFLINSLYVLSQTLNSNGGFITAQPGSFVHVNGSVSNNNSGILSVNGDGSISSSELYVTQDVVNNAQINADGYIKLLGNWVDNNNFNSTTGTVFLLGGNQFLTGSSVTPFFNLTLDGTGIKTQQIDKIANGTLDLKHIQLNTDVHGFYVTNPNLNAVSRTTGFVSSANGGFLARSTQNTGTYLFPTGSTANSSANIPGSGTFRYRPVEINPVDANSNVYSVRLANLDATQETFNRNSAEPIICESNPLFYHQIDRVSGNSAADLGICYIPSSDGDWNDMARWNITTNGIWQDIINVSQSNITGFTKSISNNWNDFNDIPYILTNLKPNISINSPLTVGCSPLNVDLETTSENGVTYTWFSNGVNIGSGDQISDIFTNPGCYDIMLTATIGNCSVSETELGYVCVQPTPNASFNSSLQSTNDYDQNIAFYNTSDDADYYYWDFGSYGSSNLVNPNMNFVNVTGSIPVTLFAYSNNGCVDSVTSYLNYSDESIYYVPNTFTPDQDAFNQNWGPVFTNGFDPYNFELYIYNRWGETIWESHDAKAKWDGTYGSEGKECPEGVYTWKITFKPTKNSKKVVIAGHLNLLR